MDDQTGTRRIERQIAERATEADARPYLLERVGEAAIVQLYADGFSALPLREKLLVWHLAQAAIAGRDIYFDQRYAHNLEMRELLEALVPEWPSDARGCAGADRPVHEAVLDQQRSSQQPDRAEIRAGVQPGRLRARSARGCPAWRARAVACRRAARCAAVAPPAAVLRQVGSPDGDEQDAGRGSGHPHGEREQPVRRCHGSRTSRASRRRTR